MVASGRIDSEWCRSAFEDFCRSASDRMKANILILRLDHYLEFFQRIGREFPTPAHVDANGLARVFGAEGLRRNVVPIDHLLSSGRIRPIDREDLAACMASNRCIDMIAKCQGEWYHDVVERYHRHLRRLLERSAERGWMGRRRKSMASVLETPLRAAIRFLANITSLDIRSITDIDTDHLNRFLTEHPGYAASIRSFVGYVNRSETTFRKIRIVTVSRGIRRDAILPRETHSKLVRECLDPAASTTAKEALILLLMLLYGQTAVRISRIRLTDVQRGDRYRINFVRNEIALDPALTALMDRHFAERSENPAVLRDPDNVWLFPGRARESHLSTITIATYLKKRKVTSSQAFATAIYNAYSSGIRHPKVLMKAFGITTPTAMKYLSMIDPRLRDETISRMNSDGR